jgi:hypothetical protein
MGWGIGIGIGWGGSNPVTYALPLYDCTSGSPIAILYSLENLFVQGAYYYSDPNLTSPFTGYGAPEASPQILYDFVNGLFTEGFIACSQTNK